MAEWAPYVVNNRRGIHMLSEYYLWGDDIQFP